MVRLANGDFANEGRIEVYCNGEWGTVCDDTFGSYDAKAVCNELGYSNVHRYDYKSELVMYNYIIMFVYSTGNASQSIWLNSLTCTSSSHTCLSSCQTCPLSRTTTCSHTEDVYIRCCKLLYHCVCVGETLSACTPARLSVSKSHIVCDAANDN